MDLNALCVHATSEVHESTFRFPGKLQSEQGPFRSLHLHYFRLDVIARTHLATELGTPLRYIPFKTVRCDY